MKNIILGLLVIPFSLNVNAQTMADVGPPADAKVMFKAGEVAYRSGDYKAAIAYFTDVIKAEPTNLNAFLQRGFCHGLLKDHDKAVADFTSVIEQKKDHLWAYTCRGSAYNKLEQYDKALQDFNTVIALDPKNEEAFNNRGWTYKGKGDLKSACKDWKTNKKFGNAEAKIILQNTGCK